MKPYGLTLLELLIVLIIVCILLSTALPSLNKQISESRTKIATLALLDAIETTRSTAVFRNSRVVLLATNRKWRDGWVLFVDKNSNGILEDNDEVLQVMAELEGVITDSRAPMNTYVSFIGTGEGKQISASGSGGFLAGTINVCPEVDGIGYSLVLSKGGRTRVGKLNASECNEIR